MKKLLLAAAAALLTCTAWSQAPPTFNKGDMVFNAGIGIGSTLYSGRLYSSTLPAISLSGEYGIEEDFLTEDLTLGVGGYIGIAGSKYETRFLGDRYGWRYTYTIIGARAALHYPVADKLDAYGGAMLGLNIVSFREIGDVPSGISNDSSGLAFSLYVGGRYYFSEHFAAMGEIGYGIAWLNLGVAYKL
ncbi:MAG: outer membrane beta-barrel protein [Cryomorphaceae bacterium]|nr:porin family protein [Flavobacteriales bacterium]